MTMAGGLLLTLGDGAPLAPSNTKAKECIKNTSPQKCEFTCLLRREVIGESGYGVCCGSRLS